MASAPSLEFWFEFGSTYSYPAAEQVERAAKEAGLALAWRPFLLGPVLKGMGINDSPFNVYPVKGRYMWRDVERLCARAGIPFRKPTVFPRNGLPAARIAILGADEPWGPDFMRGVYRANFAEDRDISDAALLADILRRSGAEDPDAVLQASNTLETKDRLRRQTEEAQARGIFGAPSFLVGEELFWGGDRLDQAIEHAKRQH